MSLERRERTTPVHGLVAAHIDGCTYMMTAAADLDAMPPQNRDAFTRAWEAYAAEQGRWVKFVAPWTFTVIR